MTYDQTWLDARIARGEREGWRGTGAARSSEMRASEAIAPLPQAKAGREISLADLIRPPLATIVLAGIPVAKGRPRIARGRAYTPEKTARWERAAKASARAQWGCEPPLEGALMVDLLVILPVPKSWSNARKADAYHGIKRPTGRPDLDNFIKAAFDALNEVAWRDDAQVVELTARKTYAGKPRVEVRVGVVGDEARRALEEMGVVEGVAA